MFDRLKRIFQTRTPPPAADSPVSRWATSQFLMLRPGASGMFSIEGQLQGHPFRAECRPSSRPYIQGLELRARVDLDLPPVGHVVVMSRAVHDTLTRLAREVPAASATAADEQRWFTHLTDVVWQGPPERFWARYVVRSDEPDLARRWLDEEAIDVLSLGEGDAAAKVPIVLSLSRGKCFLRLQVNPHAQEADAMLALELLEHLCDRALKMAGRKARRS
jgi:hypothetical protein